MSWHWLFGTVSMDKLNMDKTWIDQAWAAYLERCNFPSYQERVEMGDCDFL